MMIYNRELSEAAKQANQANEAKSNFLSTMSHDIRTPMNAILGLNEMVLRDSQDENIKMYSESIRTAGNTLLGIINDILDFSKIEAGKMEIINVDYSFASLLNDLVNMVQKKAEDKGLSFNLNIDSNIPMILNGDEIRIKQVILNILSNAVKYTKAGSVTFSVRADRIAEKPNSVMLKVSVADTGVGIKPEDLDKLFVAFERIEEKKNRNIEGTGLGMTIVKRFLDMMGSHLEVESEYGKGSVFSFELEQKVVKWDPIGDIQEAFKRSVSTRMSYHEKFTAPLAKVLVVDDNSVNLTVFASLLKRTGIQIDKAESGDECISLFRKKQYDVIFLDHMMPDKDGIETLSEMKGITDTPNKSTPVICLTANAISGMREMYTKAGFDDYLTKPIDAERLEMILLQYLPKDKVNTISAHATTEDTAANVNTAATVDTEDTAFSLTVAGSYGNFESLEAEFERFYEYYPNASLKYVTMDDYKNVISSAIASSEPPDIFTTSYGMLVNMDIFEKEGLKVPKNFSELKDVCAKLRSAGYESPVMGTNRLSGSGLFNCFVYPMYAYNVTKNSDKVDALNNFEASAGELMRPALDRLYEFVNSDCIDVVKCQEEITDEYDSVIMRFFEGDVPMMLATGDVVSGTAKRESKSDAFSAHPFKYRFFTAPAGDDGG